MLLQRDGAFPKRGQLFAPVLPTGGEMLPPDAPSGVFNYRDTENAEEERGRFLRRKYGKASAWRVRLLLPLPISSSAFSVSL
jgi:hypothetical protein